MASYEKHRAPLSDEAAKLAEVIERSLGRRKSGKGSLRLAGRLHRLQGGSRHQSWRFRAQFTREDQHSDVWLVLRLPRRRSGDSRSRLVRRLSRLEREMRTLASIETSHAAFDSPLYVCPARSRRGRIVGMLQTFVAGRPLDDLLDADGVIDRLAASAASVHQLPIANFAHLRDLTNRHRWITRLLDSLPERLPGAFPEVGAARRMLLDWTSENATSACVVHGDLRPGNVLEAEQADGGPRLAIVDWELARIGEPAVDLAAISRGQRLIGGAEGGLERLLAAYRRSGGLPVAPLDVRMHELLLVLTWLGVRWREIEKAAGSRAVFPSPAFLARELGDILRRVGAPSEQ